MGYANFADRHDAGRRLAKVLRSYADHPDVVVLGLARGGVPVAAEVAHALRAELGVMIIRKLGLLWQPEVAMGAMGPDGSVWLDQAFIRRLGVRPADIQHVIEKERSELARRAAKYPAAPDIRDKCVILVDDGLATGASMRAAIASARQQGAAKIVVAVPVAAPAAFRNIERTESVEAFAVSVPDSFQAVGTWYEDFRPTSDEEVKAALDGALA